MAIHKATRLALKALSYPASSIDVAKSYHVERALRELGAPLTSIYRLWDRKIYREDREIPVRIYTPKKQTDSRLLLFFHGGGWVLESVDTYNNVCRTLAKKTGCRVASVEYGLAPEQAFPVGVEDCYAAARAVYQDPSIFGVESNQITLIGDSAGGNLAAAVSLMARDRGEFHISQQILIYPATYHDHSSDSPFESVRENGTDYLLTSKRVRDYMELYAGGNPENLYHPYFSPLMATDFSNQPRTLILTAEYDPLRDEGETYGHVLRAAGNDVHIFRMLDALHGFFSLPQRFAQVRRAYTLIDQFLNGDFSSCPMQAIEKI